MSFGFINLQRIIEESIIKYLNETLEADLPDIDLSMRVRREGAGGRGEEGEGRMGKGLVEGRRNYIPVHSCIRKNDSLDLHKFNMNFKSFFSPLQQFPYPNTSQDLFLMALSFGLPLLLMFSFIYTAATITKVG